MLDGPGLSCILRRRGCLFANSSKFTFAKGDQVTSSWSIDGGEKAFMGLSECMTTQAAPAAN